MAGDLWRNSANLIYHLDLLLFGPVSVSTSTTIRRYLHARSILRYDQKFHRFALPTSHRRSSTAGYILAQAPRIRTYTDAGRPTASTHMPCTFLRRQHGGRYEPARKQPCVVFCVYMSRLILCDALWAQLWTLYRFAGVTLTLT